MELLYRGTKDGSTANIFHNKCDNKGPTLCLYQNDKGNVFGGFTSNLEVIFLLQKVFCLH